MIHVYTSARIVNESLYKPNILLLCIPYKDRPITVEQLVSSVLTQAFSEPILPFKNFIRPLGRLLAVRMRC